MEEKNTLTVTEAVRTFSDVINRVRYQHKSFDLKKGDKVVARLVPANDSSSIDAKDLDSFFASCPKLSEENVDLFIKQINEIRSQAKARIIKWD